MTQLIAYSENRGKIRASDLMPGAVSEITISPTDMSVQAVTSHKITFVPAHAFSDNGKIRIQMPKGLFLPPLNSQLKVEAVGMNTTVATVKSVSVIEIENLFGSSSEISMKPGQK